VPAYPGCPGKRPLNGCSSAVIGSDVTRVSNVVLLTQACIERECYPSPLNYYKFPKSCCTWVVAYVDRCVSEMSRCMWPPRSPRGCMWPPRRPRGCVWPPHSPRSCMLPPRSPQGSMWPRRSPQGCVWPPAVPRVVCDHPAVPGVICDHPAGPRVVCDHPAVPGVVRIRPIHFLTTCHNKMTKPGFSFLCLFYFIFCGCMHACVVLCLFSSYDAKWLNFCALTLLVGRQEERPACKKIEWWGAGVIIRLERGANDLHMVWLMPLPPHHFLLHWNPDRFDLSGASLPRFSWKSG